MRLPFEIVQVNSFRLFNSAAFVSSPDAIYFFWDAFYLYLESAGWTEEEFDLEILKRVDAGWTPQLN